MRIAPRVWVRSGSLHGGTAFVDTVVAFDIIRFSGERAHYRCQCGHDTSTFPFEEADFYKSYGIPPGIELEMIRHCDKTAH